MAKLALGVTLLFTIFITQIIAAARQQYKCSVCASNTKSCTQYKEVVPSCDYCLLITGKITSEVPSVIRDGASKFKQLSLQKGRLVTVRDCVSVKELRALGYTPKQDCAEFQDEYGFTGYACTCAGDC